MEPVTGLWLLVPFFFLVAVLYTSGGFGGGSSYTALLSLTGLGGQSIALASLSCNSAAVMSGLAGKSGTRTPLPAGPVLIMLSLSPVFSMLGAVVPLSESQFRFAAGLMLIWASVSLALTERRRQRRKISPAPGATDLEDTDAGPAPKEALMLITAGPAAAFLAGITGIGGGIYLAPLLLKMKFLNPRQAAYISSLFILFNSLAGLGSRLIVLMLRPAMAGVRRGGMLQNANILWYLALLAAVIAGGRVGGRLRRGETGKKVIAYTISLLMAFAGSLGVLGRLG